MDTHSTAWDSNSLHHFQHLIFFNFSIFANLKMINE